MTPASPDLPAPPSAATTARGAPAPRRGVLLFGHGARDPQWAQPFERIAERLRALAPDVEVQLGYLEFMQPDLPGAARLLAERGCTAVSIVPLFLGAGGHVRRDVPPLVAGLAERFPGTRWSLQPAIGEMPEVIEALALAALPEGVARRGAADNPQSTIPPLSTPPSHDAAR